MKVKLVTGLTYRRRGLFAQRGEPIEVEDATGAALLKSGHFAEVPEDPAPVEEPGPEPAREPEPPQDPDPEKKDGAVSV